MGAFTSLLIATITPALAIPTLCWIAPEMPQATYSLGDTVLPVCPTCIEYEVQPASTTARAGAPAPSPPRPRPGPLPPHRLCQLLPHRDVLRPADAAPERHQHIRLGD